ncbi:helix-turn-helix domain-containing protein [Marinicrinis sediminis]|uniref:Helix-turn-helix domain-containing protein n=1 Tax=Marinicrinis sediminis TaxID=1652465 RepID=A0ABW5RDM4_9BACL
MGRKINVKLNEVMRSRNLTQLQLSEMTGVRQASISEMSRNIRDKVNLRHLERIADALNIDDVSELIEITYIQHYNEE